jgi:hypothetical protein
MTTFSPDLLNLLGDRYNIELEEYWSLTNEEKDNVTVVVLNSIFHILQRDQKTVPMYIRLIEDRIKYSEYHQEFEHCEIFNRIKKELLKISPIY